MNLPMVHPREAVIDAAYGEIAEFLHSKEEPIQFRDRFGTYGAVLIALVMESGVNIDEGFPVIQDYGRFFVAVREKHGLTMGEVVSIIANLLSQDAKYIVRWERHECTDKPGGLV